MQSGLQLPYSLFLPSGFDCNYEQLPAYAPLHTGLRDNPSRTRQRRHDLRSSLGDAAHEGRRLQDGRHKFGAAVPGAGPLQQHDQGPWVHGNLGSDRRQDSSWLGAWPDILVTVIDFISTCYNVVTPNKIRLDYSALCFCFVACFVLVALFPALFVLSIHVRKLLVFNLLAPFHSLFVVSVLLV